MQTKIDLNPLYRSAIEFDHMKKLIGRTVFEKKTTYPPYNIEVIDENNYRITMAIAGFTIADIEIISEQNTLAIIGKQQNKDSKEYLHQGITARNFEQNFKLDEYVKVVSASLSDGLLNIELAQEVPETMKSRKITINEDRTKKPLEDQAA